MPTYDCDVAIIGGGIVGLATALSFTEQLPSLRIVLLEKEDRVAFHQTGHNSGVIHSGVYYAPGSLKASLCVRGGRALEAFCRTHGLPLKKCGKVIVALNSEELPRLQELHRRGQANGVEGLALMGPEQLREIEPHAAGIQALHVPNVWITDYRRIAETAAALLGRRGVDLRTGTRVLRIEEAAGVRVVTSRGEISARDLVNCAGLHADRLAAEKKGAASLQIIPFRGEYYELIPERRNLVHGLLYPVPDPRFPFLGVHLSPRIDGRVEVGPNAVLAFKREGYRKQDVSFSDLAQMLRFPGFWKMAGRHWKTGLDEMVRSWVKQEFVRSAKRLVPELESKDLIPSGSGVRAQAVDAGGKLLDDFYILQQGRSLHVCNAPSPAATASLAIGEYVVGLARKQFPLS